MATKNIPCVCGQYGFNTRTIWVVDGIQIIECLCGIRRVAQIEDSYTNRYESGSYHSEDRTGDTGHKAHAERFEHDYRVAKIRLKKMEKVISYGRNPYGRLLDVGCSNGAFIQAALDEHFEAWGCDLSTEAVPHALKDNVSTGDITSCGWERRSFDIITFNDVLEHIPDPVAALKTARGILKRTGVLVIDIPDMGCVDAIEQGPKFHHVKPHEHLWYWNASQLRNLLEANGFFVVKMEVPIPGKVTAYACVDASVEEIEILGPPGIGDILWTIPKLSGIREREAPCRIKYVVCIADQTKLGTRAKDFILLCPLIDSIEFRNVPLPRDAGNDNPALPQYELIANEHLEPQNKLLEDWRPELSTDWHNWIKVPENALQQAMMRLNGVTNLAVFYISSSIWNEVVARPDWTPKHYAETFIQLADAGIKPVLIGADWDAPYANEVGIEIAALGRNPSSIWLNLIGRTPIALAMAYMQLADVTVGIANGLPMIATYMMKPSIILWPETRISRTKVQWGKPFQTNWIPPQIRDSGLCTPMVIGKFTPADLVYEIKRKMKVMHAN